MKALFLIFHGFSTYNVGISKKIFYQKHALEQCGLDIKLCYIDIDQDGYHKRMLDKEVLENYGKGFFAKIKKRIRYSGLAKYILKNDIRFLYIRSFHNANPFLIRLLKKLNRAGVKSVLEIPTYPYDHEYKNVSFSDRSRFFIDKLFRRRLAKYICRIITYSDDKMIFGVPAINISNGIDFNHTKMKEMTNSDPNYLRLIGVAEIHFWHGFDRILEGLAIYYKKQHQTKVFFDIVGDGVPEELAKLKTIVIKNNLQEYVTFHGSKSGKELDQLFEKADMGIASLGRHRSNIIYIKPLKNREYAARGIPFVYSEIDDDFEHMPYVMKAPPDETPLDIEKIIAFFYNQKFEPIEIRETIVNKLSWKIQMGKVVDIVLSN
jgi:glycosyltransferase involved in cell wall biosynthesis